MGGYIGSKAVVTQVDGYNRTEADAEFVNDPNDVITVSGSNVGISVASPAAQLHVNSGLTNLTAVFESNDAGAGITLIDNATTGGPAAEQGIQTVGDQLEVRAVDNISFETSGAERMNVNLQGLDVNGTVTANQFVGRGAIILVASQSDGTSYSTQSTNYQVASRFQITPSTPTSRLMGWFYCQMRASGAQSDGDMGNTAQVHYLNSSGSWATISNIAQNLRTENGTSTGIQEIAVTFPINLFSSHVNSNGDWDVAIRHYEVYDATSVIDDGRFYYMEYEP